MSTRQVEAMLDAAEKRAKKEGKTLDDVLLDIVYDSETNTKDVLAAIKLFKDKTMATITEGGETNRDLGPAVFLPEQRPQFEVVNGGKSA